MIAGKSDCLQHEKGSLGLTTSHCHFEQGNQYFRYDIDTLQIVYGAKRRNICVDANHGNLKVFLNHCDTKKETQRWTFGFVNTSSLKNWLKKGARILDEEEIQDLMKS